MHPRYPPRIKKWLMHWLWHITLLRIETKNEVEWVGKEDITLGRSRVSRWHKHATLSSDLLQKKKSKTKMTASVQENKSKICNNPVCFDLKYSRLERGNLWWPWELPLEEGPWFILPRYPPRNKENEEFGKARRACAAERRCQSRYGSFRFNQWWVLVPLSYSTIPK